MRFFLAALAIAAACASSPESGAPVATATSRVTVAPHTTVDITRQSEIDAVRIDRNRDAVWKAILATHQSLDIPMSAADEAGGAIAFTLRDKTRTLLGKAASSYVDCGNGPAGPRADSYRLTVKITHQLSNPTPEATLLTTLIEAWARHPGQSGDAIQCNSRGTLEKYIAGIITTRSQ